MDRFAITSRPIGTALRAEYPEIEHVIRLNTWNPVIQHDGTYFYDDQTLFAEPSFFDVFSFPLIEGDPATALTEPNSLILTETTAKKYFGSDRSVGQTLTLDDSLTFNVTGVMADIPSNSHFTTDILVSYATLENFQPEADQGWLSLGGYTYVLLKDGVSGSGFERKMSDLVTRNFGETLEEINFTVALGLQPLTSIHLHSDRQAEWGPNGDIAYVYVFSAIALFVLLIACINFMNLATARSMERAKEVGVRKVVGSSRAALIRQFLSESVMLCGLALIVAVVFISLALPFFNDLAAKDIALSTFVSPGYILGLIGIALLVGLLAGSYPAFLLSSFPSIDVLKGTFKVIRQTVDRQGAVVGNHGVRSGPEPGHK
jgi:putative ABC transport system permease protein